MKLIRLAFLAAFVIVLGACNKDSNDTTDLRIHLTDNPYGASEVNVDIQQVRVNFRDDDGGWVNLDTRAGIYNLLDFQNGIDTVVAHAVVPSNTVKEIRFVLGNQNSIKIGTDVFPLTIPSGEESGLKIKLSKKLTPRLDSLIIDFDAALSIYQTGTGEYKLKPVLKIK